MKLYAHCILFLVEHKHLLIDGLPRSIQKDIMKMREYDKTWSNCCSSAVEFWEKSSKLRRTVAVIESKQTSYCWKWRYSRHEHDEALIQRLQDDKNELFIILTIALRIWGISRKSIDLHLQDIERKLNHA